MPIIQSEASIDSRIHCTYTILHIYTYIRCLNRAIIIIDHIFAIPKVLYLIFVSIVERDEKNQSIISKQE